MAQGAGQLIYFVPSKQPQRVDHGQHFALVTALFPPQERGRAMGIAGGTISAMGYTLGPVLGGLLTWRRLALELFCFGAAGLRRICRRAHIAAA